MRTIAATMTGVALLAMVSVAGAQTQPPAHDHTPGATGPGAPPHGGMMQHDSMGGMMCPMMGPR